MQKGEPFRGAGRPLVGPSLRQPRRHHNLALPRGKTPSPPGKEGSEDSDPVLIPRQNHLCSLPRHNSFRRRYTAAQSGKLSGRELARFPAAFRLSRAPGKAPQHENTAKRPPPSQSAMRGRDWKEPRARVTWLRRWLGFDSWALRARWFTPRCEGRGAEGALRGRWVCKRAGHCSLGIPLPRPRLPTPGSTYHPTPIGNISLL